ncbi:MAG: phosphoribosylaminoimidazolesuccinocarboxamide synthase [Propionibacteriaceae bacterium]|jgi:phosphoribosylaminoimidazole-succinocarboxamide synthase|nr:phosphoribosylaminoimidazolesuccinocarboxamide synthase [Propionibacteriaceae bacterium]
MSLELIHTGKVRQLYRYAPGQILMVATDNISAFDFVLSTPIPDKGKVLTQLSLWWFEQLAGVVENHVISTDVPAEFAGRSVIVEELQMVPVEAIVRGYLTGSGLAEYRKSGTVTGIDLPAGLTDGSRLPEAIFTPSTKAEIGAHDENISFATLTGIIGAELAERVRATSLAVYTKAEEIARARGIILADTKFEFGLRPDGTLVLADEVLTPDSSRFWDAATWAPGGPQPSFDKQYVRDWLSKESGWDKASDTPPPPLPAEVVAATRARYLQAYRLLTGSEL